MLQAKRMVVDGLRTSLRQAFAAMWTIEGRTGIFWYVTGCKKDYTPKDGEVVAETNGATAVFRRDEVVEKTVADALGVSVPA